MEDVSNSQTERVATTTSDTIEARLVRLESISNDTSSLIATASANSARASKLEESHTKLRADHDALVKNLSGKLNRIS
jgi:hypothetical protein